MHRSDFTFDLPDALIARHPLAERSASRLLRLDRDSGAVAHGGFRDLLALLNPGDLLVFNQSRVMPARLFARKASGGQAEILIERLPAPDRALAHVRASKSPRPGSRLRLADAFDAEVLDHLHLDQLHFLQQHRTCKQGCCLL